MNWKGTTIKAFCYFPLLQVEQLVILLGGRGKIPVAYFLPEFKSYFNEEDQQITVWAGLSCEKRHSVPDTATVSKKQEDSCICCTFSRQCLRNMVWNWFISVQLSMKFSPTSTGCESLVAIQMSLEAMAAMQCNATQRTGKEIHYPLIPSSHASSLLPGQWKMFLKIHSNNVWWQVYDNKHET